MAADTIKTAAASMTISPPEKVKGVAATLIAEIEALPGEASVMLKNAIIHIKAALREVENHFIGVEDEAKAGLQAAEDLMKSKASPAVADAMAKLKS